MQPPAKWQDLVRLNFSHYVVYIICSCISLILGMYNFAFINAFLLLFMLIVYFSAIPLNLNYTNGKYFILFSWLGIHMFLCIFMYAWHYKQYGIQYVGGQVSHDFYDALYFSASTWTTVGYGDFVPTKPIRFLTSLQAMTALLFMPIATSILWSMIKIATKTDSNENIE